MLSETQRHELIGLIVAGYSRYAAAKKVGCARSTIYRLAARDPVFGGRLAEAEELAGGRTHARSSNSQSTGGRPPGSSSRSTPRIFAHAAARSPRPASASAARPNYSAS